MSGKVVKKLEILVLSVSRSLSERWPRRVCIATLLLTLSAFASANAGLPMLAIVLPLSLPAFLPVIAVESWLLGRTTGTGWRAVLGPVVMANILSTLVGVPLAWIAMVALEFSLAWLSVDVFSLRSYPPSFVGEFGRIVLAAPWLGPISHGAHWILPVATITLLVPFFFASFWSEAWYLVDRFSPMAPRQVRSAIWRANLASYFMLLAACLAWLAIGLYRHV
ncbi:MAG: hypothetical protein Q8S26_16320 [Azonexus sp.]|nr:hypothetical protein [Azonexus sp.]